ncbi:MAG: LysR family transcriptional regulator [Leptolyngbyaceae cyanobacterium SL_7_1]|nr:LysR family transcriptional regulator [Leptolyngbyaceae cyanobacterium SL_7_1]
MSLASSSKVKISQLQAFVAVVEHGNFSAAALELGLTQSTVSHAIAALEEELGVILLNRGRYGATLTDTGKKILEDAHGILQLLQSIRQKASLDQGLEGGQVRIASVRSVSTHLLPEVIAQFAAAFPMVNVAITEHYVYSELEQALRDGQADLGFTILPTANDFDVWGSLQDEFVALLPPDSLKQSETLTWEKLIAYPMIMTPSSTPHRHTKVIIKHLAQYELSLNVAYEVQQDSTVISMVRRGLGATIMARLAAEPIPDEIQVRSLPNPLYRTIGVIIAKNTLLPRSAFAFLDVLKRVWTIV